MDEQEDELREIEHICRICDVAEARSGLSGLCLRCFSNSEYRILEEEKLYRLSHFKTKELPLKRLESLKLDESIDFGLEKTQSLHLVVHIPFSK